MHRMERSALPGPASCYRPGRLAILEPFRSTKAGAPRAMRALVEPSGSRLLEVGKIRHGDVVKESSPVTPLTRSTRAGPIKQAHPAAARRCVGLRVGAIRDEASGHPLGLNRRSASRGNGSPGTAYGWCRAALQTALRSMTEKSSDAVRASHARARRRSSGTWGP